MYKKIIYLPPLLQQNPLNMLSANALALKNTVSDSRIRHPFIRESNPQPLANTLTISLDLSMNSICNVRIRKRTDRFNNFKNFISCEI